MSFKVSNSYEPPSSKLPIRCWKSLYMKLTSVKIRYQDADIESELSTCRNHFKEGIFQFFSNVPSSCIELRENKTSSFMESFYQRLAKMLHLNVDNCKEIFANYLLYNCNNSSSMLQERLEKNIRAVLLSTWSFYAQERIFFLKCYFHIISSSMDPDAPYSSVFNEFLSEITPRDRYSSVLKQYTSLIHQELPTANMYGVLTETLIPLWINFNLREQLELLNIIILLTSQIEVTLEDIDQLVHLIQITSFGRYQCFFYHHSHLTDSQNELQRQIHCALTFYSIQILSHGWNKNIYEHQSVKFTSHNKIMYPSSYDAKQGPIVMAWILVLFHRIMNTSSYDEHLSNQSFILLDEDLWKLLDEAVHSNIMDIPAICSIIEPVIDEMVYEMFSKFGICAFHSQMTLSSIVAFFCKFHTFPFNKSTSAVLQYSRERFPIDSFCFFKILGAVLNWCDDIHRKEVLEFLNHLKFSVRSDECKLKTVELNKYVLECELHPLKHVPKICISRGTEAIPDSEENIVTIKKSLPMWDVMRNYLLMYLNEKTDTDIMQNIMEMINFVEIYLQKVKTIDDDILQFSELVVHVIWKTSTDCSSPEELKLLAYCIKLHSVLFCIMPEDIIKCFEIYNFLPGYPVRMKRKDIQIYDTYYTQSRIYTIVCCKEAKVGEYSVLFSYLNFFHNVVQNMLESWYTVAGLKFIFHVYNNVNNDFWKFKNLEDRNLIIWNCIEIIHEILNHGLKDLYDKKHCNSLVDFEDNESEYVLPTTYFITRSCVLSILNSVNENTILSTAITGDIALLEIITESPCWTNGRSAIFINIITYSLSLVQRCLIFIDVEKKLRKTEVSFDHLFQPEKCLALLSYRYNCFSDTLCQLAIKLLIRLASIKENCMFSWLQYSNELLQKEFLYPLYSNNESTSVKSSLLALMAVCIMKQIVIADALLEIDKVRKLCLEKSVPDKKWQNLLLFTSRYILDMEKKKETFLNNMHCSVIYVIFACWEKKLKVPQQFYKMSDEFWKHMMLPFRSEPRSTFNGYGFILETVCLEISSSKNVDTNLKNVLKSFFVSEDFLKWTKYCSNVIDEVPKLSVEFEPIPVPTSAVADSWKKFLQVVTSHCCDLIEVPGVTAYPILENLTEELSSSKFRKKEKFLCDVYRIYLTTWKDKCSETNWRKELVLASKVLVSLNEVYQNYNGPYFFSAVLEVCYKIFKFGGKQISVLNEMKDKTDFLLACSGILNHVLKDFANLIINDNNLAMEYPPLLLHISVFINVVKCMDVNQESMSFMLRETDFMNLVLKVNNNILAINRGTKSAKILLQFQNFMCERFPSLKTNFYHNSLVLNFFQIVFPGELPVDLAEPMQLFSDHEKNNLFRFGLNFISNLTSEVSNNSKNLLIDFHSRNKQYMYAILQLITVSLKEENLHLIIAAVTFYKRITQHIHYCKFSEIEDLIDAMFLLFGTVKTAASLLIQPSKMCSFLLHVPSRHLSQYFEDTDDASSSLNIISSSYKNLMYLVKIGIQTLSTFCIEPETTLYGVWPTEDWNFRWLNKIKSKDRCLFPLLLLDHENVQEDFTILATFITLEHKAFTKRMTVEKLPSIDSVSSSKITLLEYDKSGETLSELSIFLFSQSSMYLLHPHIDQSKKLFFINQIFVNLKEFIRNAINDNVPKLPSLPAAVEHFEEIRSPQANAAAETIYQTDENGQISPEEAENNENLLLSTLHIVAGLFYKLITTFKHS